MKIAISATGPSLDAEVDPRFGRCQYFIIVDSETTEFEAVQNTSAGGASGVGIVTAQMIAGKGVSVVLTGNCGPNAYQGLSAAGVQVISGVGGKVGDAVEAYKTGKLQAPAQPNVAAHYGMGATPGMGMGGGMGRGRGMGRGMGMGMGQGMGQGMTPMAEPAPQAMSEKQEVEMLESQSQVLGQQLKEIQRRLDELEKRG